MKLLIYSHFFAPSIGGVETIVLSLARGLTDLRNSSGAPEFEITLVTQTPAANYDEASLPFRVVRQPTLLQLWRLIRSSDVVHLAGPALAPLLLTRLARKPLVIEHHGYQATCPNGLLFHHPTQSVCRGHFEAGNYLECWKCNRKIEGRGGALRLLISTFFRGAGSRSAAKNIAPSHYVASRQGLPRTEVILHGVQDSLDGTEVQTGSQAVEKVNFAFLGRLVVEKGVSVLVEAARLLCAEGRSVRVLLIGDGPDRPRLESQIAASHLESSFRFTGFLTGAGLVEALRDVHVVVMPSVWEETAGLAALEQMARGRVVIASAIGGLGEIVDGAGLTFAPGDSVALAEAIGRILDDPALASSSAVLARQRVLRSFSFGAMIDAHACLYRTTYTAMQK